VFNEVFRDDGVGSCRGFRILSVSLFPVQYIPKPGVLYFFPDMTISVEFKDDESTVFGKNTKSRNAFLRCSDADLEAISSIVCNPDDVAMYSNDSPLDVGFGSDDSGTFGDNVPLSDSYIGGLCDSSKTYEYVIITGDLLKDTTGYTYNWSDLIDHRKSFSGLSSIIVTVEEIDACTNYWNDTELFNDSQAHIREFCKDAYLDWGTEYVLLGGDWRTMSHPSGKQIVPCRIFEDRDEYDYYKTMPSDLYYSNLDGDWYYGSGMWGGGKNGANDKFGELYVGRITAYNGEHVSNVIEKIIWYDYCNDDDWLSSCAFFGGNLGWSSTSKDYMEELRRGDGSFSENVGFEEWNVSILQSNKFPS